MHSSSVNWILNTLLRGGGGLQREGPGITSSLCFSLHPFSFSITRKVLWEKLLANYFISWECSGFEKSLKFSEPRPIIFYMVTESFSLWSGSYFWKMCRVPGWRNTGVVKQPPAYFWSYPTWLKSRYTPAECGLELIRIKLRDGGNSNLNVSPNYKELQNSSPRRGKLFFNKY